ncbi:MAG: metal-dependent transcriptional regulator [Thermoanaerobaculia bacterium]|nr:metal-dependent transcriptional regulator [Thermoanaerobaculia bacterium]
MTTSTVEDYLKTILLAEEAQPGSLVATGRIAAALQVVPGTATSMVKTLAESGLVTHEPYNGVRLTEAGRRLAAHVLRRHRLVELFLVEVMGLDWSEVHQEAERLEHVISERLLERMDEMLGRPEVDPHGDPIPGPEGGVAAPAGPIWDLAAAPLGRRLRVTRVLDQESQFLQLAQELGLVPGTEVVAERRPEGSDLVELTRGDRRFSLGLAAAGKIRVEPVE